MVICLELDTDLGSPGQRAIEWVCVCVCVCVFRVGILLFYCYFFKFHFQSFDAVGWAPGRASGFQKLCDDVLVWLSVWSEVFAYGPADATASQNPIVSCLT